SLGARARRGEPVRRGWKSVRHQRGGQSDDHDPGARVADGRLHQADAGAIRAIGESGVLSTEQRALLRCVLNRLVPPRAALCGGGASDGRDSSERRLSASPRLRRLFLDGFTQITVTAVRMAGADLCALAVEQQTRVLQQVEQARPGFFAALVEHAY